MISLPNSIDQCQIYWGGGTACRSGASKQDAGDGAIWNRPAAHAPGTGRAHGVRPGLLGRSRHPGSRRLAGCNSWTVRLPSAWARQGREVRAWTFPGTSRRPQGAHQAGTGGGREPKCGSGLAATPTSCNHLQPLECTGETREIYLFIVGICGQWVFLMKTICFCVFPENIIP